MAKMLEMAEGISMPQMLELLEMCANILGGSGTTVQTIY
jgi:hypothetical protein